VFGKRNKPAQSEQPRQGSDNAPGGGGPGDTPSDEAKFPWDGDPSYVACNLATGNLANNLGSWVAHEGRLHAETYVAASPAMRRSDR
jgi:hypothetical protein